MARWIRHATETKTDSETKPAAAIVCQIKTKLVLSYACSNACEIKPAEDLRVINNRISIVTGSDTRTCNHRNLRNLLVKGFPSPFFAPNLFSLELPLESAR